LKDLIWYQKSDQRLAAWRELRQEINTIPLDAALCRVSEFWSFAPYVTYYLDPARPQDWPDPWLLLSENYYCDLAKTLGIFYTIALTDHGVNDLKLRILYDINRKEQINIVVVNNKQVINYHFAEVVNTDVIAQDTSVKYSYDAAVLKISDYK
jgi:hypothetical protein